MAELLRSLGEGVTAHFRFATAPGRPWRTDLRTGYKNRLFHRRLGIDWQFLKLALTDREALFVLCSWDDPTQFLATLLCRRCVLWTDTPDLSRRRGTLKRILRDAVLRVAFHRASAVMGTGQPALDALQTMGCPLPKLVNFPYFIDLDAYRPSTPQPGPLRVFSCGRLVRDKGYDTALRALALSGLDFLYRIAGTGPEEINLRALAQELSIASRVEFLGWLEPEALRQAYTNSTVFVHPARFEPYGVCILEAMASGLTVAASTATAAATDRIAHGENGYLHAPGSAADLAALLNHIGNSTGPAARKTAESWPLSRAAEILRRLPV